MSPELLAALTLGVFLVALLYSSVGHAGASGYIAVMALSGLAPDLVQRVAKLHGIELADDVERDLATHVIRLLGRRGMVPTPDLRLLSGASMPVRARSAIRTIRAPGAAARR